MQQSNVHSLEHLNRQIPEAKNLMKSVMQLPWNLRVPMIAGSLGFSLVIDSKLLKKDLSLPRGSLGTRMGFRDLHGVISSPQSEGGLGLEWDEWASDIKAYRYKSSFGIHYEKKQDVIDEYNAVETALGRPPVTINEFSKARDEIILMKQRKTEKALRDEISDLKYEIDRIAEERNDIASSYDRQSIQLQNLEQKLETVQRDHESKISALHVYHAEKIEETIREVRSQVHAEYADTIADLNIKLQNLTKRLESSDDYREKFEQQKRHWEQRLADLRKSNEKAQVEIRSRDVELAEYKRSLAGANQTIDDLREELLTAHNVEYIDRLKKRLGRLEKTLEKAVSAYTKVKNERASLKSENQVKARELQVAQKKLHNLKRQMEKKRSELEITTQELYDSEKSLDKEKSSKRIFALIASVSLVLAGTLIASALV